MSANETGKDGTCGQMQLCMSRAPPCGDLADHEQAELSAHLDGCAYGD